ncbi:GDP-mannose:cellobiosyl-diphosphopolyprenol alpha-mannosyltransferase [subsurface metagenome]
MKILQVCPKYFPSIGGVEQHVRNISERLAREHEVTVFATDPSGELPKEERINGVLVRRFKSFSPQNAYHVSFEMLRELRSSEFDIVHGHSYHAFPLFFSRYAKKKRFVVTPYFHGHGHTIVRDFLIKFYKPFGKKSFQEADKVIALSNHEKDLLIKDFKIADDKIAVIPIGIDLEEFNNLEKVKGKHKTILCVVRLEEYKGVQYIIQALLLLDAGMRLEIVGNGPYKEHLIRLIKELGLEDRIDFYQGLSREELLHRYANADLLVLLSRYESFGITVAEALASKTPCIVANTSALKEWVDGENCFGVDYPVIIDRLAGLINEIIGRQVGEVKLWDWDDVVEETVRVYEG